MKTSSIQTIESSSSNRLLKGERKRFGCLATARRDTTRRPGAFTGTMNQRCLPLPGGNSSRLVISRSSAKGVLVCIWILPDITMPSADSLTRRSAARWLSSSRSLVPMSGPPPAKVRNLPVSRMELQVLLGGCNFLGGMVSPASGRSPRPWRSGGRSPRCGSCFRR